MGRGRSYTDWTWVDDRRWGEWFLYAPGKNRFICSLTRDTSDPVNHPERCWGVQVAAKQGMGWDPEVEGLTLEEARMWAEDNLIPEVEKLSRLGRPLKVFYVAPLRVAR